MKLFLILLSILVVLAIVSAGGVYFIQKIAAPKPIVYQTQKIDVGEIAVATTATGSVEPTSSVKVGSQVSGRVKAVKVEQDDPVKAGQPLAILDTELMENDQKDKEILLRQTKSNLAQLEIETLQLDLKEERLKQSLERERITRDRVKASLELARKTFARYEIMVQKNAAPESDLDVRRLERDNAERDLQLRAVETASLEADLKEIQISRKMLVNKVQLAELAIEQADQALKRARMNLGYAVIVSPIDGVVMERTVDTGQTIAAQFQTPDLFKIAADLKQVLILANIDEVDVGKIKPGQHVSFEVDAFRNDKFSGVVKTLHLKSETKANLVSYPVVIEAGNPPTPDFPLGKLRPGMTAFLEFDIERKTNATRIPAAALRYSLPAGVAVPSSPQQSADQNCSAAKEKESGAEKKPEGTAATVYIKDAKGDPKPVQIRVGENNGQYYELLSTELKAGDEVIVGNQE